MNESQLPSLDWPAVIADAVERLEWVAAQSSDAAAQSMLLQQSGESSAVPLVERTPEPLRRERRAAVRALRMSRYLGDRKGARWAGRASGSAGGVFDPSTVTAAEAEAVLTIVRGYVRRHAGPVSQYPLSPEGQDDAVSRIVAAIWTRDYTRSTVGAGNLAGAVWQACSLYRRTAWVGESVLAWKDRRRKRGHVDPEAAEWEQRGHGDNPARIAAAIEAAAGGLWAVSVENRGRVAKRATRGGKRMPAMAAADARLCLLGVGE